MNNADKKDTKFTSKYTLCLKYLNKNIDLSILANEFNTYTAYHIDHSIYNTFRSRYNLNIMFDISRSNFCNTFLDIGTYRSDDCDHVNKFNGIFTQYKDIITYKKNQSIVFNKVLKNNKFIENKLDIYILGLTKFSDSFIYCICNRQFIDENRYKSIVRSSSFCIYTRECYTYLNKLYKKYKSCGVKYQDTEDAISSLFGEQNENLTPQQIQNGFTL